jgi:uncharacterized FlaG/YvyC family protein
MTEVSKVTTSSLVEGLRSQVEAAAKVAEARSAQVKLQTKPDTLQRVDSPLGSPAPRVEPLDLSKNIPTADLNTDRSGDEAASANPNAQAQAQVDLVQRQQIVREDSRTIEAKQEAKKAVSEANRQLAERLTGADSRLVIEADPRSGGFVYKSVDKNGAVKAEWPREEFLRVIKYFEDISSGALVDRKF